MPGRRRPGLEVEIEGGSSMLGGEREVLEIHTDVVVAGGLVAGSGPL